MNACSRITATHWNAYHFTSGKLRDGSPIPAIGETLVFEGKLEMCWRGYHASRKAWQAIEWAPGPRLHRVHCGGELYEKDDKLVCRERTILASIDATNLLREFARSCARDVLHLWDAPDVVREYLETGNEDLRVVAREAADAARNDAGNNAREAARGASGDAAWSVRCARYARAAAWAAAAKNAASEAAKTARVAAMEAEHRRQRSRLTRMVNKAFAA